MSEDSDAEKTEAASPKRLEQAREEGDVPRSREVATFTVLMASGCCLWFAGDAIVRRLTAVMVSGLTLDREQILNPDAMMLRIGYDVGSVLLTCLPMLGDYFTSDLLSGSPSTSMVGNLINNTVLTPGQTGQAGAFVLLVLLVSLLPMVYYVRSVSRNDGALG